MKCKFADLNIEINSQYDNIFQIWLEPYRLEFEKSDINFTIKKEDIDFEKEFSEDAKNCKHDFTVEKTCALRKIGENLPNFDAAVLHSASFAVDDIGIAFGALSGTGKTTHMFKWSDMLGDRFQIVNGDKPFIRFINDELYIYGNPWAGKEGLKSNIKVPLKHICHIVRSEINHTEPMTKQDGVFLLLNQIYMPSNSNARAKTLQLINRIAETVNFWKISCNMDHDAAEVAYKTIFNIKE